MNLLQLFVALTTVWICNGEFVGKFVFHGNHETQDHGTTLSVLNKPDSVNIAPNPSTLPLNEISSVLSLSLGLSVPKDITWNGLLAGSLFKRPRAVLFFSVSDIPKGQKLNLKSSQEVPVEKSDDFSTVGDIYAMTSSVSVAGHVNGLMGGRSTTVSISADEKIAGMGYSQGQSSTTSFWDEMSDTWRTVYGNGESKVALSKHSLLKRIALVLPKGFTLDMEEKKVVVNTKDLQFSFNLRNKADLNLFSELVFMEWYYEQLVQNKKAVKDDIPDVYLFSVSALKGLEKQYGADSKQMKGALKLLEHFIPMLTKEFSGLYGGDIFIVGLTIESELSHMAEHKEELNTVLKTLKDQIEHKFDFTIPELHVAKELEHKAKQSICRSVQGALATFAPSLKFKCHNPSSIHKLQRRSLLQKNVDASEEHLYNIAYAYDNMFPIIFNIWFWLLVVLALTTYAISVCMWNMDPGRDSIIYRLTQTKIKGN